MSGKHPSKSGFSRLSPHVLSSNRVLKTSGLIDDLMHGISGGCGGAQLIKINEEPAVLFERKGRGSQKEGQSQRGLGVSTTYVVCSHTTIIKDKGLR